MDFPTLLGTPHWGCFQPVFPGQTVRVEAPTHTGVKGVAVEQYDMPALVKADPDANATDLLIDRVAETPDLALFALPTADGGWSDVTAARVPPAGASHWRRVSSPPGSSRATRSA